MVQPLDVDDDDEVVRAHEALVASTLHGRPWGKTASVREFTVDLRRPHSSERLESWVGLLDGQVVGLAMLWFPLLDNTRFTWFDLQVHPDARRHGVGSALLDQVLESSRAAGRSSVLAEFSVPDDDREDHGYVRFARRHGFTYVNTEIRRILDLPVDPAMLERYAAESAARHEGYRVESYAGGLPEELRPSYCDCWNRLATDAPTGEVEFEPESLTPQTYAEDLARMQEQGRTMLTTVAIAPEGRVVAYNDLVVSADDPDEVMQWGTLVLAEHRGHRLGMAVKARGLQELARLAPGAKRVQTCNAEQNQWMVAVNVDLGFRKVEAMVGYQHQVQD